MSPDRIGRARRVAAERLPRAVAKAPDRTRAFKHIGLATTCILDQDLDPGVSLGWTAANAAETLRSVRVRDRLRPLAVAAIATASPDARGLGHHLVALTAS